MTAPVDKTLWENNKTPLSRREKNGKTIVLIHVIDHEFASESYTSRSRASLAK